MIENVMEALDTENEWYFDADAGKLYESNRECV